jgi:hypothetical protein
MEMTGRWPEPCDTTATGSVLAAIFFIVDVDT